MLYVCVTLKSGKDIKFSNVSLLKLGKSKLVIQFESGSYSINIDSIDDIYSDFEK